MTQDHVLLPNARTMTAGYSDSEDRMWLRFGDEENAVQMWLTRRLLSRLLTQIWGWLAQSAPAVSTPDESARRVAARAEREVALEVKKPMDDKQAREAEPKAMSHRPQQAGVVQQVQLKQLEGRARLTFTSGGGQVVMVFGRAELHRMLQMLATRAQASDWGLQAPWGE